MLRLQILSVITIRLLHSYLIKLENHLGMFSSREELIIVKLGQSCNHSVYRARHLSMSLPSWMELMGTTRPRMGLLVNVI
jgi:hypothetical protein